MPESITAPNGRGRIHLMDELRGFAVFCMVFYHGFYTFGYLFGNNIGVYFFNFFMPAEPFFAGMFLFISGIASYLTHSNLRRGTKLLAVALGVTLVTRIFVPEDVITFGVLHFLAVCMILFGFLKPYADRFRFSWIAVIACFALYFLTRGVPRGFLGCGPGFGIPLPGGLYTFAWLAPLGFPGPGFKSSDYFPVLPWIFVFAAGTFVGKLAKAGRFPEIAYRPQVPILSWFGRHALVLYLFHQPVIYGLCLLLKPLAPYLS
ncbi:hypothetical protein CAFE_16360 [Caprobacter fermentans]|uniref:Heparan-alpha-glucosaminide N-acetyltransferase catalytic domain-containing protein n=1 Tax=Caproicibacter fermentans TaxID=2576756 RepID=A0A6N8HZA4_9FIRM|nr:heparan-alpha-glucosaminide N-acetyltransferase [Caproicibacter fermentans]MVB10935.1 hypothetical protein [Caproicibacter fermentans]OCN01792.1 hypothetical protein A7X67_00650 [Clostridium sp. W14A]